MARQKHTVSAATFREPVLRALGTLTNLRANAPVKRDAVIQAVLAETGYSVGQFGTNASGKDYVTWAVGRAYFLMKRDERLAADKMKRGMWGLSESGVKVAATLLGAPASTVADTVASMGSVDPTLLVAPSGAGKADAFAAVAAEAGIPVERVPLAAAPADDSTDEAPKPESAPKGAKRTKAKVSDEGGGGVTFVVSLDGTDTYNSDPYIRSLAIQSTSCFGQFSTRSPVCGDCPLSVACKSKMVATMSSLAATLRQRDVEAVARAKAEAEAAEARKSVPAAKAPAAKAPAAEGLVTDETIDDIMDELERGTPSTVASKATAPAMAPTTPASVAGGEVIEAVVPTICAVCDGTINAGEKCQWVAGKGVYHAPGCP